MAAVVAYTVVACAAAVAAAGRPTVGSGYPPTSQSGTEGSALSSTVRASQDWESCTPSPAAPGVLLGEEAWGT